MVGCHPLSCGSWRASRPTQAKGKRRQSRPRLRPGGRLLREWNGVTHVVDVVEGGFLWRGERHRSLSAIARAITGAHWSGPRFFGLQESGSKRTGEGATGAKNARTATAARLTSPPAASAASKYDCSGIAPEGRMTTKPHASAAPSTPASRSEEGLEQEFNSLDAQREACEAYIASQKHEGWKLAAGALRRRRLLRRHAGAPCPAAAARRHRRRPDRHGRRLQDRPADPLARRLRQAGRAPRCRRAAPSSR